MSDHNDIDDGIGLGEWTPGAQGTECFREELFLRIVGTAGAMSRMLEAEAHTVLSKLQKAAAEGSLCDDRAEVEMAAVGYAAEHSTFIYNWVHVMLTTRVLDALRTLSWDLADVCPKGKYSGKCELKRLQLEFVDRFGIEFSRSPVGDAFLEGMVVARNKIVHNGARAFEASSPSDAIAIEGTEAEWSPSNFDREFVARFPDYVDGTDRIAVSETLFKANVDQALAFVSWVGEQIDSFVKLLVEPAAAHLPV